MRAWHFVVVLVAVCACERASQPGPSAHGARKDASSTPPPAPTDASSTPPPLDVPVIERLRKALVALEPQQCIYLAGMGWWQMHRYPAYTGRNPRTGETVEVPAQLDLSFDLDPELDAVLAGEVPQHRTFPTERDRLLHAIHGDDPLFDPDDEDPRMTVEHHDWSDELAASVRGALLARGTAEIVTVGTFELVPRADGSRFVRFRPADAMKRELALQVASGRP